MRITELLKKQSISLTAKPSSKQEAINEAVRLMMAAGNITNAGEYRRAVFEREKEGTTGIGEGIAIPHGKSGAVREAGLAAMRIPNGVDFEALDDEPVTLLFLIAAPETESKVHLEVLSRLSAMLMRENFAERLRQAESVAEFLSIIDEEEEEEELTEQRETFPQGQKTQARLLAVTSCPTGIAHTYMAAESLKRAAKAAGVSLKVETRGSGGAKNVLTEEEIAKADGIIVAADAKVPMERFAGKRVMECPVSDGIHRADWLIEEAWKTAPLYTTKEAQTEKITSGSSGTRKKFEGTGHTVYTQLMNGVSHMLPFVVGGGILIALAFLIDGIFVDMGSLTPEERAEFGMLTPTAAFLKTIGGTAFQFMLPVLAGYIAAAIGDRPALAPGFVAGVIAANGKSGFLGALAAGFLAGYLIVLLRKGCERLPEVVEKLAPVLIYPLLGILVLGVLMNEVIEPVMGWLNTALNEALLGMSGVSKVIAGTLLAGMMAVDMGGPFNKAAYVFGTAAIASGNYDLMAAVMIGGMVPPIAIAIATLLFRDRFTKAERESGPTNLVMGLAFITEGAIPFAAADPLHVIPACVLGAGAAGALSAAFGCTLMAPHGGIFVFPVVGNAWLYLLALAAGSLIGAGLLGVWKRRVEE